MSGLDPGYFFLVDGIRSALYDRGEPDRATRSHLAIIRHYFLTQARARRYRVIDMQPAFIRDSEQGGKHSECPRDGHWNERGHDVAARQFARALAFTPGPVTEPGKTGHMS